MWMCCLTQAGVSLGLASEVAVIFPMFGRDFQTALIAVIIINQVLGPILFRVAMRQVGDSGKAVEEGEFDPDAAIPMALVVGHTPAAMAVTVRLLTDRWNVTMLCESEEQGKAASYAVGLYGIETRRQASKDAKAMSSDQMVKNVTDKMKKVVALTPAVVELAAASTANKLANLNKQVNPDAEAAEAEAQGGSAAKQPEVEVELDEHGHPIRHLEDCFKYIVFSSLKNGSSATSSDSSNEVKFHTGSAPTTKDASTHSGEAETKRKEEGEEAEGEKKEEDVAKESEPTTPTKKKEEKGEGHQQEEDVSNKDEGDKTPLEIEFAGVIANAKSLAAVVFGLNDDQMNFDAAQAVRNILQAAPKKSTLHSVRLLALLRSPSCGPLFASVQCIPVHPELHTSVLAAKLLQSPLQSPVVFMKAPLDLADMCKNTTKSLQGEELQTFTEKFTDAGTKLAVTYDSALGDAAGGGELDKQAAASATKSSKPMDLLQGVQMMTSRMPKNLNQLRTQLDEAWNGGEQVGDWDGARDEYVEQLAGLDENRASAW